MKILQHPTIVKFTYNSTDYTYRKSFNEILGARACASNDGTDTSVYGIETAIAFANANSPTNALYIHDITLLAAGTDNATAVIYNSSGSIIASETVTVIITSYGAESETIVGNFEGTLIAGGTFKVYNNEAE